MKTRIATLTRSNELRAWLHHQLAILAPDAQCVERDMPAALTDLTLPEAEVVVLEIDLSDGPSALDPVLEALGTRSADMLVIVIGEGVNEINGLDAPGVEFIGRGALNAQRLCAALSRRPRPARAAVRAARTWRREALVEFDLPQYSILHRLGDSNRAEVYLAHSTTLGRDVALKISKPLDDSDDCQQFSREYAALSAMNHPSVVEIYDYGFHEGREFIAMEYFPCGDLKMRLQQPITVLEALEFAQRICGALQVVHAAGIVHRDLKPPNVMLRADGSIVLIDFGIAKGVEAGQQATAAGVLRGSPYYMSPEQAQGQPLDARSDLYSLGVILFEMLTGSKPYVGNSAIEVMQQHVSGQRPPLPNGCEALEPLLAKLMAVDRAERFPDSASAYRALLAAIGTRTEAAAAVPRAAQQ